MIAFEIETKERKKKTPKTCQTNDFIAKCVQSSIKAITFWFKARKTMCQTIDIRVVEVMFKENGF